MSYKPSTTGARKASRRLSRLAANEGKSSDLFDGIFSDDPKPASKSRLKKESSSSVSGHTDTTTTDQDQNSKSSNQVLSSSQDSYQGPESKIREPV